MKRLPSPLDLAALLMAAVMSLGAPAAAQEDGGDKVRMVIVYGDDEKPVAQGDEILVIATLPESERYRIPEALRTSDDPSNTAWAKRVESFQFVGDFGTLSCSPSGAGGFTGCTKELIDAAFEAKAEAPGVRFAKLIEAARAERLSSIDAEAAAEQERVEAIERAYMERLERERDGDTADEPLPQLAKDGEPE